MELSKNQIKKINEYLNSCGIKWHDVREEIADHFASILEVRLTENPNIDFKKEIVNIHKNFSKKGFTEFIKSKEKSVNKKFYKSLFNNLKTFFKLPKIVISTAIFYLLLLVMNLFEDKETFFRILTGVAFLTIGIQLYRNKEKENYIQFLTLHKTGSFLQLVNMLVITFNTSIIFRNNTSFQNPVYNKIHLAVYVVMILFYWSGEYVYAQNRKQIQKQYPTIKV